MNETRIRIQARMLAVQETDEKLKPEQDILRLALKMMMTSNKFQAASEHKALKEFLGQMEVARSELFKG
jgi:hypothetical protein